jgi:hypothetical protein
VTEVLFYGSYREHVKALRLVRNGLKPFCLGLAAQVANDTLKAEQVHSSHEV